MFSLQHCDMADPKLRAAGAQSYAVLVNISNGLDWDKADLPEAARRTEMMLWSLVHGYATLSLGGQFAGGPAGGVGFDIGEIMPDFGYLRQSGD